MTDKTEAQREAALEERDAIVAMLQRYEEVHLEHAENGKRFRSASRNHADACRLIADAIERGDHIKGDGE